MELRSKRYYMKSSFFLQKKISFTTCKNFISCHVSKENEEFFSNRYMALKDNQVSNLIIIQYNSFKSVIKFSYTQKFTMIQKKMRTFTVLEKKERYIKII